ncbi:hypothetical protein DC094_03405 [Pelagibaculum spongiae]|uniref:Uncharacterized protein n=2 Tax=Pelagibaculum spongiae TaxID=2080658 RepID=A0A2V1H4C6_9GAMM|nr:hypothetical protein DC094_03405 [Pelagibaculum spongiae]
MPYKKSYAAGDLIYGLSEPRQDYRTKNPAFILAKPRATPCTIDQYSLTTVERQLVDDGRRLTIPDSEYFHDCIKNHDKYSNTFNAPGFAVGGANVIHQPVDTGRKCKGGLYWVTSSMNDLGKSIHFVLDGIDFAPVVSKINPSTNEPFKNSRSPFYTGIELRWVYRNRFREEVYRSIQFWINGSPCPPPWEAGFKNATGVDYDPVEMWSTYKPRSLMAA